MTESKLRVERSNIKNEQHLTQMAKVQSLKDKGYSNINISKLMNISESLVRSLLSKNKEQ